MKLKITEPKQGNSMKMRALYYLFIVLLFCFSFLVGLTASGQEVTASVRFNNDNLMTSPHPAPIGGGWDFGTMQIIPLGDGKTLIVDRYILNEEHNVNIWKYGIDDAYWFVTNKGIIYGENDIGLTPFASSSLQALSIFLTL